MTNKAANSSNLESNTESKSISTRGLIIILSIILLPVSFYISIAYGATPISNSSLIQLITHPDEFSQSQTIVQHIRIPRSLLAVMVGALLGICGTTTQGLFRNPLADPSLIGVTAGASAGAAVMIFFGSQLSSLSGLQGIVIISVGAFIGGVATVLLVYTLATRNNVTSVTTMLLAGIAITAIAGGLTNLIEFFANNEMLKRISIWRMGGLEGANEMRVMVATITTAFICVILPRYSYALNALLLGESEARHLGINVQRTKIAIIVLVAAGVAISVALAGSIAFVGLVVPHIFRLLIGPDHRYLMPMSAIGGATLMLLADTLARTIVSPIELPVGLVTALIGAPFFVVLLRHRHNYGF